MFFPRKQILSPRAGFSLVELMIVVGIIGILSSMSVAKFHTMNARARQAEAQLQLKQVGVLAESVMQDTGSYPVFSGTLVDGINDDGTCGANYCNLANPLNFKIVNCAIRRYDYYYRNPLGANTFEVQARETNAFGNADSCVGNGNRAVYPHCDVSVADDQWRVDDTGRIWNQWNPVTHGGCI